jgi:hypothetical protein
VVVVLPVDRIQNDFVEDTRLNLGQSPASMWASIPMFLIRLSELCCEKFRRSFRQIRKTCRNISPAAENENKNSRPYDFDSWKKRPIFVLDFKFSVKFTAKHIRSRNDSKKKTFDLKKLKIPYIFTPNISKTFVK